jgi:hypothetical protein
MLIFMLPRQDRGPGNFITPLGFPEETRTGRGRAASDSRRSFVMFQVLRFPLLTDLARAAAAFSILAALVPAQSTCGGTPGPDVIVGDITGPANYTANAGLEALSLGTTSCNLGTSELSWQASTAKHPVIGGDLYRFEVVGGSGRFEQLGFSWVKHGFFALSENLCCATCHATDGTSLGVGCSDPYTADGNGVQSLLGPRYVVNPFTGAFPYPNVTHPAGVNVGRIQVGTSELAPSNPSGPRYFGGAQYIAADDASGGNGDNNASYREITVSGSGDAWTFGFTGATQRELAPIEAWPSCEAGVTLRDVRVPGEGLLILGSKTTDLGGGMYHYEYALYNMNSDLAAGGFSIPVPDGVTLTNVAFHDVEHRGGDGIGGVNQARVDWPATRAGGAIAWSSEAFAANPNANAIRWGTTYNFRFDANSAPKSGTITIRTFKDGGSVQTTGDIPGGSVPPADTFCYGDASSATTCPCGNKGDAFQGCDNASATGGAVAFSTGALAPDTLVIACAGERPTALSVFLQASASAAPVRFGDGLRCLSGTTKRLAAKNAVNGEVVYPEAGETGIRDRSTALGDVIPPGGVRYYQVVYRDSDPAFCPAPTGSTFNASSGLIVVWP